MLLRPLCPGDAAARAKEPPSRPRGGRFLLAASNGHADVIDLLYQNGFTLDSESDYVDENGCTALMLACRLNDVRLVSKLLKAFQCDIDLIDGFWKGGFVGPVQVQQLQ